MTDAFACGARRTRIVALGLALLVAGCGLFGTQVDSNESVGHGDGRFFAMWEQAAVAEALRLTPHVTDAKASKFKMTSGDKPMRVKTADGYCHIFGGKYDARRGWQANDIGSCAP